MQWSMVVGDVQYGKNDLEHCLGSLLCAAGNGDFECSVRMLSYVICDYALMM